MTLHWTLKILHTKFGADRTETVDLYSEQTDTHAHTHTHTCTHTSSALYNRFLSMCLPVSVCLWLSMTKFVSVFLCLWLCGHHWRSLSLFFFGENLLGPHSRVASTYGCDGVSVNLDTWPTLQVLAFFRPSWRQDIIKKSALWWVMKGSVENSLVR